MYILTVVQVRKRTSHGPFYLVPHDTVVPPGDGSQNHSVRTTLWCTTAVEVEEKVMRQVRPPLFIRYYLTRGTGTRTHSYLTKRSSYVYKLVLEAACAGHVEHG